MSAGGWPTCAACRRDMWRGVVTRPSGRVVEVKGCAFCHTSYEQPVRDVELPETVPLFEVNE